MSELYDLYHNISEILNTEEPDVTAYREAVRAYAMHFCNKGAAIPNLFLASWLLIEDSDEKMETAMHGVRSVCRTIAAKFNWDSQMWLGQCTWLDYLTGDTNECE